MPTSYNFKLRGSPIELKGVTLIRRSSLSRFHPYCFECRHGHGGSATISVGLEAGQKLADNLTMPRRDHEASVFADRSFLMSHQGGHCSRHTRLFSDDCKPSQIKSPEKPTLRPYFEEKVSENGQKLTSLKRHVSFDEVALPRNASFLKCKKGVSVPAKPTLEPFYRSNGKFYKVLKKMNQPSRNRYLKIDTV